MLGYGGYSFTLLVGYCKSCVDSAHSHSSIHAFCRLSTVFPQPWYRGPTKLAELTETSFRAKVCPIKKKSSASSTPSTSTTTATMPASDIKGPRITEIKDDEDDSNHNAKYWVVMLYANWSVSCLNFEAVLAKLSLKYDASHLKFGKVKIKRG